MRTRIICTTIGIVVLCVTVYATASARTIAMVGNTRVLCRELPISDRIVEIAKRVVSDQVDDAVQLCYESLSDFEKAKVFEAITTEMGLSVEDLRKEADDDARRRTDVVPDEHHDHQDHQHSSDQGNLIRVKTHAGSFWRQLVERVPFSAVGVPQVSSFNSYQDPLCDSDPNDVDYMFGFQFPSNVNNPNALRDFSSNLQVDSMLSYYQVAYSGIDGRGYTDRPGVYVCLGDNGVASAGGQANVQTHMKLHR